MSFLLTQSKLSTDQVVIVSRARYLRKPKEPSIKCAEGTPKNP